MPNLLPFRDYDEHDVINFYSCAIEATRGTVVKPTASPAKNPIELSSFFPGAKYGNTVTALFEVVGKVTPTEVYTDKAIGILLYDVKQTDENGNKLILSPSKAIEKGTVLPNVQSAPILTKGIILINDIDTSNHTIAGGGAPSIGDAAYVGDTGRIGTDGTIKIGKFLSTTDANGYVLVKIDFD